MSGAEKNSVGAKGRVLESPNNLWEKNVEDKSPKAHRRDWTSMVVKCTAF